MQIIKQKVKIRYTFLPSNLMMMNINVVILCTCSVLFLMFNKSISMFAQNIIIMNTSSESEPCANSQKESHVQYSI